MLDLDAVVGKCIGGNPETGENASDTATTVCRTLVTTLLLLYKYVYYYYYYYMGFV